MLELPGQVVPWLELLVDRLRDEVVDWVEDRSAESFGVAQTGILASVLSEFVGQGKFLRSTFAYLGWSAERHQQSAVNPAAVQAAASLELLHAFALLQDDVMDESTTRRGNPAVHVRLASWARTGHRVADADRFGESAAILLSDLSLIWAERMFRQARFEPAALARAWPVYDVLRSELAVGQYSDLLNQYDSGAGLDAVLDIARRKSGNYTVLRPLELGAALAGATSRTVASLSLYGVLIGEAFQLRDDLLGVFGDPRVTGKPLGDDLRQRKLTTVIAAARELADGAQARRLQRLGAAVPPPGPAQDDWVRSWQQVLRDCGAEAWAEQAIADRVSAAVATITGAQSLAELPRQALLLLADRCARRST